MCCEWSFLGCRQISGRSPYLASEEELIAAGLGSSLKKCLTVTGGGCQVDALVHLKLFLGKTPAFLDEHGRKTASRPVERVQVKFTKSYLVGNLQWTESCVIKTARRERSSVTFIFLSCARVRVSCWVVVSLCCGSTVEMRGTFLAASCLPPSIQNDAFLFTYSLFSLRYSLKASWRFSTRSTFVAASQRFIFRWKYRLMSSFFFSTPFEN